MEPTNPGYASQRQQMVDAEAEAAARYAAERAVLPPVETYTSNERAGMMMAGGLTYLVGSGVASVGEEMILVGGVSALVAAGVLPETWVLAVSELAGGSRWWEVDCAYTFLQRSLRNGARTPSGWE